ncbi:hypothetical protein [Flavobacterium sedimenticola]|uniref:Fam-a protein n=1 Tax=Flavobacterium sedimenticola TaxID=3043286 RepID=A0ABT6XNX8_9FLAO|nr:hypothetical protein [Flavobacterium sedimenticola]MDI9256796.1 hypothetical protein [Flavobacterium sedimenticola]
MKAICIYYTFLAVVSINATHANTIIPRANHSLKNSIKWNSEKFKKPEVYSDDNTAISLMTPYKKTIDEVIAEDRKIIGNITNDKTQSEIERTILENNSITESTNTDAFFPLENTIQKTPPIQMLIKL